MSRQLRFRMVSHDYSGHFKVRTATVITLNGIQDPMDFREIIRTIGNEFNIADNSIVKMSCADYNNRPFYINTDEIGRLLMKDVRGDDESLLERVFNNLLNSNENFCFLPGTVIKLQFWMVNERGQWFMPSQFLHNYEPETYNPMSLEEIQLYNRNGEMTVF